MPVKGGKLTPREAAFVGHMAASGDPTYSAKMAGYQTPAVDGWKKSQSPIIAAATRKAQLVRINNDLLPKALDLIERVIMDDKEATRNRLAAAQIVVKYSLGGKDDGETKEPHEMTPEELQARIDTLRRAQADKAKPVIEHEPEPPESGVFD